MNTYKMMFSTALLSLMASCSNPSANKEKNTDAEKAAVDSFLLNYNQQFQKYLTASNEGQWALNTHIVANDTATEKAAAKADEAMAAFTGSKSISDKASYFLQKKDSLQLNDLQVRQLHAILFNAGANPEAAGDIVKQKIAAQNKQTGLLYGFKFSLNGKEITPNDIDAALEKSTNEKERLAVWLASKEVGKALKNGLTDLRNLRNKSVQPLGYSDFFSYQASEYGMSTEDLMQTTRGMIKDIWPLYRELHTWARYELAKKYNKPVPDYIPAHWLPNRWGQEWSQLVEVKGFDLDPYLKKQGAEWIVKTSEAFYKSIGFDSLPQTFWERSSLYPVAPNAGYKKNTHASAWHIDNDKDVRSLMSVVPNTEWWSTALHELGHIYYYLSYSNPSVPIVLRSGANRAYHEAFGTMMGMASLQKPFLQHLNMVDKNLKTNDTLILLKEALQYIVHIPWGSGTMTEFEYNLYSKNTAPNQYNKLWWDLVKRFQGIEPPVARNEDYCDAATKTHINDDAAQYYDYSMSNVLLFQFHQHIAQDILKQDPHATNYWGNKEVGAFLQTVMKPGASVDWREHLKKSIGQDFSAKPMLEYFSPLMNYLKRINAGRKYTLPEQPDFNY
ncbi:MAG: M2 family metallopeptidase [Bacteroidetes bacterium]|nr:M2 family metallopeptidase [Bacteroidota bacterium]